MFISNVILIKITFVGKLLALYNFFITFVVLVKNFIYSGTHRFISNCEDRKYLLYLKS